MSARSSSRLTPKAYGITAVANAATFNVRLPCFARNGPILCAICSLPDGPSAKPNPLPTATRISGGGIRVGTGRHQRLHRQDVSYELKLVCIRNWISNYQPWILQYWI
ncbi:hypothetical protein BKA80DRAFT_263840 [Phyllosticta citrichinensis]